MNIKCATCEDTGKIEVTLSAHSAQVSPVYKEMDCPDCKPQWDEPWWRWKL